MRGSEELLVDAVVSSGGLRVAKDSCQCLINMTSQVDHADEEEELHKKVCH